MLIIALALALLVGLSLGLLGGGGSVLTVPILRYVLGMEAHAAIALSLLVVGTTSLAALVPHARAGRVRVRTGVLFGLAGMAGAYGAGRVAHLLPPALLLVGFALMMLGTAYAMLRKKGCAPATSAPRPARELPLGKVLLEGAVVGAVTGLVGAGGGFLVVPALVLLGGLPMELAVGTSLVVIAMKSLAGFAGYLGTTHVDFALGLAISAAAIAGSVVGGALVTRIPPPLLRRAFGWFVIAMAIFVLVQELPGLLGGHGSLLISALSSAGGTAALLAGSRLRRCLLGRKPRAGAQPVAASAAPPALPSPVADPSR